jgi:hypothetical protein
MCTRVSRARSGPGEPRDRRRHSARDLDQPVCDGERAVVLKIESELDVDAFARCGVCAIGRPAREAVVDDNVAAAFAPGDEPSRERDVAAALLRGCGFSDDERARAVAKVANDHAHPVTAAVRLDVGGDVSVESERGARGREHAGVRPDEGPVVPARRADERVRDLWTDEVRLRRAARVRAAEGEQRAGGCDRSGQGERAAAVDDALAAARRPAVDRAAGSRRLAPHDALAAEHGPLPEHARVNRARSAGCAGPEQGHGRREEQHAHHHVYVRRRSRFCQRSTTSSAVP